MRELTPTIRLCACSYFTTAAGKEASRYKFRCLIELQTQAIELRFFIHLIFSRVAQEAIEFSRFLGESPQQRLTGRNRPGRPEKDRIAISCFGVDDAPAASAEHVEHIRQQQRVQQIPMNQQRMRYAA